MVSPNPNGAAFCWRVLLCLVTALLIQRGAARVIRIAGPREESTTSDDGGQSIEPFTFALTQTIEVEDIVVFEDRERAHHVYELPSRSAFDSCDLGAAKLVDAGSFGTYMWEAKTPGFHYFVYSELEGDAGGLVDCSNGRKVEIFVTNRRRSDRLLPVSRADMDKFVMLATAPATSPLSIPPAPAASPASPPPSKSPPPSSPPPSTPPPASPPTVPPPTIAPSKPPPSTPPPVPPPTVPPPAAAPPPASPPPASPPPSTPPPATPPPSTPPPASPPPSSPPPVPPPAPPPSVPPPAPVPAPFSPPPPPPPSTSPTPSPVSVPVASPPAPPSAPAVLAPSPSTSAGEICSTQAGLWSYITLAMFILALMG